MGKTKEHLVRGALLSNSKALLRDASVEWPANSDSNNGGSAVDIANLNNERDMHYLAGYAPSEARYTRYAIDEPFVIASGHKVVDVYQTLCRARGLHRYAYSQKWGDISDDQETNVLFAQSQMLIAALIEYGICMDIGLQLIWASYYPTSLELLVSGSDTQIEKLCTSEAVHSQLNCFISQHGSGVSNAIRAKEELTQFENNPTVIKLREVYNTLKHRSHVHIQGLGENDSTLAFTVQGRTIPKLHRPSFTIEELDTLLVQYDSVFSNYIATLVTLLLPSDYESQSCSLVDMIGAAFAMYEASRQQDK